LDVAGNLSRAIGKVFCLLLTEAPTFILGSCSSASLFVNPSSVISSFLTALLCKFLSRFKSLSLVKAKYQLASEASFCSMDTETRQSASDVSSLALLVKA
jgi:hypothetical protein